MRAARQVHHSHCVSEQQRSDVPERCPMRSGTVGFHSHASSSVQHCLCSVHRREARPVLCVDVVVSPSLRNPSFPTSGFRARVLDRLAVFPLGCYPRTCRASTHRSELPCRELEIHLMPVAGSGEFSKDGTCRIFQISYVVWSICRYRRRSALRSTVSLGVLRSVFVQDRLYLGKRKISMRFRD